MAEELLSLDFFLTGVPALLEASERSWDENMIAKQKAQTKHCLEISDNQENPLQSSNKLVSQGQRSGRTSVDDLHKSLRCRRKLYTCGWQHCFLKAMLRTSCHSFGKLRVNTSATLACRLHWSNWLWDDYSVKSSPSRALLVLLFARSVSQCSGWKKLRLEAWTNEFLLLFSSFLNSPGGDSLLLRLMPAEAEKLFTNFLRAKFYGRTTLVPFQVHLCKCFRTPSQEYLLSWLWTNTFYQQMWQKLHCLNKLCYIA